MINISEFVGSGNLRVFSTWGMRKNAEFAAEKKYFCLTIFPFRQKPLSRIHNQRFAWWRFKLDYDFAIVVDLSFGIDHEFDIVNDLGYDLNIVINFALTLTWRFINPLTLTMTLAIIFTLSFLNTLTLTSKHLELDYHL